MQTVELNAEVTSNHEIHLKLPDFVHSQAVKVIVLYEQETPTPAVPGKRQFGQFRGELVIADDFDEPLPESFWLGNDA
jgi:hypothetical protein